MRISDWSSDVCSSDLARARFEESWRIIELALRGEPFAFKGRHFSVPREIVSRPRPYSDKIHFYGAIGSPASGAIMGTLGLAPFCLAQFPDHLLTRILDQWQTSFAAPLPEGSGGKIGRA